MEPRIQYAKTEDGVSIAYWTMGNGVPVVFSFPIYHLLYTWESPVWRPWLEAMAARFQLVVYDARGNGLSQRDVTLSPEAMALDLQAVVDQLALEDFFVFAPVAYGHGAVHYTVAHPDRIAGLILWSSFVNGEALDRISLVDIAKNDWDVFLRSIAQGMNWLEPREVRDYVDLLRKCSTQADYLAFMEASLASDVGPLLPIVQIPALVLHPRELDVVKVEEAPRLASMLPNAQLVLLEGPRFIPVAEHVEPAVKAIAEFIDGVMGLTSNEHDPATGGFATILFTDMEGSTTLADRLGDAAAQEIRQAHNEIVRAALTANAGSEIKHTGDGIMASFATASSALDAAIAIQRVVAAHKEQQPDSPLGVYVGINAGEPIAEDDGDGRVDLFGTSVNLAARICDHAEAGQILAANVVRELAAGKDFLFSDLGETELRGFEDPVKLWELRWQDEG